ERAGPDGLGGFHASSRSLGTQRDQPRRGRGRPAAGLFVRTRPMVPVRCACHVLMLGELTRKGGLLPIACHTVIVAVRRAAPGGGCRPSGQAGARRWRVTAVAGAACGAPAPAALPPAARRPPARGGATARRG